MKTNLTLTTLLVSISFSLQAKVIYKLVDKQELLENKTITIYSTNFKSNVNEVKIDCNFVDSPRLALFKRAYKKIVKVGNIGVENLDGSKNVELLQTAEILKSFNENDPNKKLRIYLNAKQLNYPKLNYFGNIHEKQPAYGPVPICVYPVPRLLSNFKYFYLK